MKIYALLLLIGSMYSQEVHLMVDSNVYSDGRFIGWMASRGVSYSDMEAKGEYYDNEMKTIPIQYSEDDVKNVIEFVKTNIKDRTQIPDDKVSDYIRIQVHIMYGDEYIQGLFLIEKDAILPSVLYSFGLNSIGKK